MMTWWFFQFLLYFCSLNNFPFDSLFCFQRKKFFTAAVFIHVSSLLFMWILSKNWCTLIYTTYRMLLAWSSSLPITSIRNWIEKKKQKWTQQYWKISIFLLFNQILYCVKQTKKKQTKTFFYIYHFWCMCCCACFLNFLSTILSILQIVVVFHKICFGNASVSWTFKSYGEHLIIIGFLSIILLLFNDFSSHNKIISDYFLVNFKGSSMNSFQFCLIMID